LAALGILSLLLIHPERERDDQPWIDRYARIFWVAILPAVAMLLLAIWQRIDQYGITERRYFLTVLAVWLAATAVFHAVTRSREIKGIPLSLGLVCAVTFFGPWSAYSVAEASQVGRLERLLESNGALADGRVRGGPTEMSAEDWQQTSDVLRYLFEHHGAAAIDPWFDGRLATIDTIADGTGPSPGYDASRRATLLMSHLAIESVGAPFESSGVTYYDAEDSTDALPVAGYDYVIPNAARGSMSHVVVPDSLTVHIAYGDLAIEVRLNDGSVAHLPLGPLLDRGRRGATRVDGANLAFPRDSLTLEGDADGVEMRLYLDHLNVYRDADSTAIQSADGTLLLRMPREQPF
ncbi:MAG: DUF4153 domain-containing protein, partial [Gemmatimonadetes bacterium]|nr:DUF4153 domain-containing protein [Gemmatimonadota bacterium]